MNKLSVSPTSRATQSSLAAAQAWVALQFDAAIQLASEASADLDQNHAQQATARAWRAASVVESLQQTLDMRRGGELAQQLAELFVYVQQRLRSVAEPAAAYREVVDLLSQVRQAWQIEPALVPTHVPTQTARMH